MNLELISITATDKVVLPGLLYTPDKPTKKVTVWLHAMGDNGVFYKTKLINELAKVHTDRGIAFLAFNNRGAHGSKRLKIDDENLPEEERSLQTGTYYELISDAPKDIEGAVEFLQRKGFNELYLAGTSTGANKICVYDASTKTSDFKKYILAAPGDDTGGLFNSLGAKRFWQTSQHAAKLVGNKPLDIMPKYSGMYPFSVQSAWDLLNPDGDYNTFPYYEYTNERIGQKKLFKEYTDITIPTLVVIGDLDEYAVPIGGGAKALDIFLHHTSTQMMKLNDFELVRGAGHSFSGFEMAFAEQLTDWLIDG